MAKRIEERVVKVTLDNDQFEAQVKRTLGSLEELKAAMDMRSAQESFNVINKASESVKFNKIEKSLDSLQERFSTLGIIGKRALENLTDSAMASVSSIWNNSIGKIFSGGLRRATNIDQASFLLEGLGLDVQEYMGYASNAVDGTAYALDVAAQAAAKFASSMSDANKEASEFVSFNEIMEAFDYGELEGPYTVSDGLKKADKEINYVQQDLEAVAGVAAMTGLEFDYVAGIFTDMASVGHAFTDDFNRLSRGINVKEVVSRHMQVSTDELSKMVQKGLVSYRDFADALYEEFADQATKANNTYEGALSNLNSALGRIGQGFYTNIRQAGTDSFNVLRVAINSVKKGLEDSPIYESHKRILDVWTLLLKTLLENDDVLAGLTNLFEAFGHILDPIANAVENLFTSIFGGAKDANEARVYISPLTQAFKEWTEVVREGADEFFNRKNGFNLLGSVFKGIASAIKLVFTIFKKIVIGLTPGARTLSDVFYTILSVLAGIGDSITELYNKAKDSTAFEIFGNILQSVFTIIITVGSVAFDIIGNVINAFIYLFNAIKSNTSLMTKISSIFKSITEYLKRDDTILRKVVDVLAGLFGLLGLGIYSVADYISSIDFSNINLETFTTPFKKLIEFVREQISGLFNLQGEEFKNPFGEFFTFLREKIESITGIEFDKIGESFTKLINSIFPAGTEDMGIIDRIIALFTSVKDAIKDALPGLGDIRENIKQFFVELIPEDANIFTIINIILTEGFKGLNETVTGITTSIGTLASGLKNVIDILFGDLTFYDAIRAMDSVSLLMFVSDLNSLNKNLKDIVSLPKNIGDFFKQFTIKAPIILDAVFLIASITASLAVLSLVDPGRLIVSVISIGIVLAEVVALFKLISTVKIDTANADAVSKELLAFSASIFIIFTSLKSLAGLNVFKIAAAIPLISSTMLMMIIAMRNLSRAKVEDTKTIDALVLTMLGFAASISIILGAATKVIKSVDSNVDALELGVIFAGIIGIIFILSEAISSMSQYSVRSKDDKTNILGMAIAAIAIAGAVRILVGAVKEIVASDNSFADLMKASLVVGALITFLGIATKLASSGNSIAGAVSIFAMVLSMQALFKALATILNSNYKFEDLRNAVSILGLVLLSIGGAAALAGRGNIRGLLSLLGFANVLAILFGSLAGITAIVGNDGKKLQALVTAAEMMGGLVAVFGIIMMALTALSAGSGVKGAASILAMSAAMVAFAASVGILTLAFAAFAKINADAWTIVGFIAAMTIPLAALIALAGLLPGAGVAMLAFGAGILGTGAGLFLVATAMTVFIAAFTALVVTFSAGIGTIMLALAGFKLFAVKLGEILGMAASVAVVRFAEGLADGAVGIIVALAKIVGALLAWIGTLGDPITAALLLLGAGIMDGLGKYSGYFSDRLFKGIINILDGLADAVRNNIDELWRSGMNILEAIFDVLLSAVTDILKDFGPVTDPVVKAIEGWRSKLGDSFKPDKSIEETPDKYANVLDELRGKVADGSKGIGNTIDNAAGSVTGKISDFFSNVIDPEGNFGNFSENIIGKLGINDIGDKITKSINIEDITGKVSDTFSGGLPIESITGNLTSENMTGSITDMLDGTDTSSLYDFGADAGLNLSDGFSLDPLEKKVDDEIKVVSDLPKDKTNKKELNQAGKDIENNILEKIPQISEWKKSGNEAVNALIKTFNERTEDLNEQGILLGKAVDSGFRTELQIQSPSKVFEDNGLNIVAGAAKGMAGEENTLFTAGSKMADSIAQGFNKAWNAIKGTITTDFGNEILSNNAEYVEQGASLGKTLFGGLNNSVSEESAEVADTIFNVINGSLEEDDLSPTITPVMDMSLVVAQMEDMKMELTDKWNNTVDSFIRKVISDAGATPELYDRYIDAVENGLDRVEALNTIMKDIKGWSKLHKDDLIFEVEAIINTKPTSDWNENVDSYVKYSFDSLGDITGEYYERYLTAIEENEGIRDKYIEKMIALFEERQDQDRKAFVEALRSTKVVLDSGELVGNIIEDIDTSLGDRQAVAARQ